MWQRVRLENNAYESFSGESSLTEGSAADEGSEEPEAEAAAAAAFTTLPLALDAGSGGTFVLSTT